MDDNETINNEKDVFTNSNISNSEKWIAGILLILLTIGCGVLIVSLWPDRIPEEKENIKPLYLLDFGNVRLIDSQLNKSMSFQDCISRTSSKIVDSSAQKAQSKPLNIETNETTIEPSGHQNNPEKKYSISTENKDTIKDSKHAVTCHDNNSVYICIPTIHLNSLLMILVALCGFFGNMIFLSSSFTTFVANKRFDRSWLLWYCVKPFTASALAMGVYFAIRGGLLNLDSNGNNINLYGTLTLAFLTGLFTDRATEKLKELVDVLFRPKEKRPDSLDSNDPEINELRPISIEVGKEIKFVFNGIHLPVDDKLTVTLDGITANISEKKPTQLIVNYTLAKEFVKEKIKVRVLIDGVAFYEYNVDVLKPKQQEKEDVPTIP